MASIVLNSLTKMLINERTKIVSQFKRRCKGARGIFPVGRPMIMAKYNE